MGKRAEDKKKGQGELLFRENIAERKKKMQEKAKRGAQNRAS